MNWYRVLSSAIEEALRRGHHVECWHNAGAKGLLENVPQVSKVPAFANGKPIIREYWEDRWLVDRMRSGETDVVVDCLPPPWHLMKDWPSPPDRSLWVVLDGPPTDSVFHVGNEKQLLACDLFALQAPAHLEDCISMMTQDREELLQYVRGHLDVINPSWLELIQNRFGFRWDPPHVRYFRERACVVGNTALDICSRIDPGEVRRRWGIAADKPVVALLPCAFGQAQNSMPWERMYMSRGIAHRLWIKHAGKMKNAGLGDLLRAPTNERVLRALRNFCNRSGAALVAKLRHSRRPDRSTKAVADIILANEAFHPHTALELYSISQLTVGFYTSGAIEAVALGSPYLNIEIESFPNDFFCHRLLPAHTYCEPMKGVIWNVKPRDPRYFAGASLEQYAFDAKARMDYLDRQAGVIDGSASGRFIAAVEARVKRGRFEPSR